MFEKVLVIEEYETPEVVEYLQVAFSSVVKDRVAWVVPAESSPVGEPLLLIGGLVSEGEFMVIDKLLVAVLLSASLT